MCDDKGLVIGHTARGQPTEFCSQVGDMVKFTAAENNSSGEVRNLGGGDVCIYGVYVAKSISLISTEHSEATRTWPHGPHLKKEGLSRP